MFIKIFCGDSQKYLLLQSNNVTLDKTSRLIHSDLYPIMCAYIEEMSLPIGEKDGKLIESLCDSFTSVAQTAYNDKSILVTLYGTVEEMFPNTPHELLCPMLSEKEEYYKNVWKCPSDSAKDEPMGDCNKKLSIIEVDDKTYITSGPIFVMNDDGKTMDRI